MTRHVDEAGPAAPTPSTPDLKDVLRLVYLREKSRQESTWRRACSLAAEDTGGHDRLTPSDKQRSIFRAVGNEETSLDAVRGDDRLRLIVQMTWLEPARTQIREKESRRLGCTPFAESSWEVMYTAYTVAVSKLVPNMSFLRSSDSAEGWEPGFKVFCEWLVTGEGTPYEKWHEAFRILDEVRLCNELLNTLWKECPKEAKDLGLPKPADMMQPMTEGQKRLWDALEGETATGKELAKKLDTSEETVRQWVSELRKAGHEVENRAGRGYYRPDAPPQEL